MIRIFGFFLLALLTAEVAAQNRVTLSGYVRDATGGEELFGATVFITELAAGAVTNTYGFYSVSVPPGTYTVRYDFLGYKRVEREIDLSRDTMLTVSLERNETLLQGVEITGERRNENITNLEIGVNRLDAKAVKAIPQFMGEVDIIRSIGLLPGVSSVGEGATGFNVRGGNIDQNLILLDEATVFNSSHLFGFFSVFNADAVKDLTLYKGGVPARFGGRLSAVLDVHQKEGNSERLSGTGGIGLVSSRLMLEGPIIENKMSFMVAGRRSYGDLLLPIFESDFRGDQLFFYDVNAKLNFRLNDKNRFFLSGYNGADKFKFGEDFQSHWGNSTATLRWNHLFGPRLFSNFTAVYSDYTYSLGVPEGVDAFNWEAGIQNSNFKADFTFFPRSGHTLDFGVHATGYLFSPGYARGLGGESYINALDIEKEKAWELAAYVSNKFIFSDRFSMEVGLRYGHFLNVGERDVFLYDSEQPISRETIVGKRTYGAGEIIAEFGGLEPRAAVNYTLSERASLKAGYNRMYQYIHLISNSAGATPLDIWKPAGNYIKPAMADQLSVGYFRNLVDDAYRLSTEVYYKQYRNLVDYKDNAQLFLNESIETELLAGDGRAYGLEIQLEKVTGKWTGWISYTLSRSEMKVPGINNDEYYPANHDKTHDLTLVANFTLNEKWQFGGNWVFMTGRPVTFPDSRYVYEGIVVPNYGNRNGARSPDYHRLDLSATFTPQKKREKVLFFIPRPEGWQSSWTFSLYNAYGRRNAYSIFFRRNEDHPQITEAYRLSIFGTVIPGITYNLNF